METPVYKGMVLTDSRVTSRVAVPMQTKLQTFLKTSHTFKEL